MLPNAKRITMTRWQALSLITELTAALERDPGNNQWMLSQDDDSDTVEIVMDASGDFELVSIAASGKVDRPKPDGAEDYFE